MKIKRRSWRWPLSAAVTISLVALTISSVQMFLTVPVLNRYYFAPKLVVGGSGADAKSAVLGSGYTVKNEGNAAATRIEVGLVLRAGQQVRLVPNIAARIVEENDPFFANNVRVEVDRLTAGESFRIEVLPDSKNKNPRRDFYDFYVRIRGTQISFIRSAEGAGRIVTEGADETATSPPARGARNRN